MNSLQIVKKSSHHTNTCSQLPHQHMSICALQLSFPDRLSLEVVQPCSLMYICLLKDDFFYLTSFWSKQMFVLSCFRYDEGRNMHINPCVHNSKYLPAAVSSNTFSGIWLHFVHEWIMQYYHNKNPVARLRPVQYGRERMERTKDETWRLQLATCFQFVWVLLTCWGPYLRPPCDDLITYNRMCSRMDCRPGDASSML